MADTAHEFQAARKYILLYIFWVYLKLLSLLKINLAKIH